MTAGVPPGPADVRVGGGDPGQQGDTGGGDQPGGMSSWARRPVPVGQSAAHGCTSRTALPAVRRSSSGWAASATRSQEPRRSASGEVSPLSQTPAGLPGPGRPDGRRRTCSSSWTACGTAKRSTAVPSSRCANRFIPSIATAQQKEPFPCLARDAQNLWTTAMNVDLFQAQGPVRPVTQLSRQTPAREPVQRHHDRQMARME